MGYQDRTAEQQKTWERFLCKLDRRYFHISPADVVIRGSAMTAKHIAQEQLPFLAVGAMVHVSNEDGIVWCQRNK